MPFLAVVVKAEGMASEKVSRRGAEMRRTQSFKGLSLFICLVCFSIKPVAKSFLLSLLRVQEIGRLGEKFKKSRQLQDSETPIGESNERADLA